MKQFEEWCNEHIEDAKNPDWEAFDKEWTHVHDWRTYVTEDVRENWDSISLVGRCAVIACCEEAAGNEEWD